MSRENEVKQAGGFILQLMPFAEEEIITALETKLAEISSVTSMLDRGMTPEDMLQELLGDLGVTVHEQIKTEFFCNCDKKRVEKAIISIGKKEIGEMIAEGKPIEVNCHFCGKTYEFSVEELKRLLKQAVNR